MMQDFYSRDNAESAFCFAVEWSADAQAAFEQVYADDLSLVEAHRQEVETRRELLFEVFFGGYFTARFEHGGRIVLTGAAGNDVNHFLRVLDYLESVYRYVCVETYRKGILHLLSQRGYEIDHYRVYKKTESIHHVQ